MHVKDSMHLETNTFHHPVQDLQLYLNIPKNGYTLNDAISLLCSLSDVYLQSASLSISPSVFPGNISGREA